MSIALYPGRFDPVTAGHLDIVERASKLFSKVVISVFEAPDTATMFTTQERVALFQEATSHMGQVEVRSFHGLVVDQAHAIGAHAIVRGIRMNGDFEYEFEMALMNRKLAPDIDVVCLMTDIQYQFVRASLLKEVARLGGDITGLAPASVIEALRKKFQG